MTNQKIEPFTILVCSILFELFFKFYIKTERFFTIFVKPVTTGFRCQNIFESLVLIFQPAQNKRCLPSNLDEAFVLF
jgi:hypothetical protein